MRERNSAPPPDPTTSPSRQSTEFKVKTAVENYIEIKLAIEFPIKGGKHANDVALFFKRFTAVLMAANSDIKLLKWEKLTENPIAKAIDITYDEVTISKYYSGMKMKLDQKKIVGFTCIYSPVKFEQIKKHSNFFNWLQTNKVWVQLTTISSSRHTKIRWLLDLHPYTSFPQATKDLPA